MRHAEDAPSRPIHGVFDGDQDAILATIDEAYLLTKEGGRGVDARREGDRMVYTVSLNRRIGYVGGQAGKRQQHPAVQRLRLVLEGDRVITCFPLE